MTIIPILETKRLRLRPFRDDDLDGYARICADPEVMRYLGGATQTRAEAWRHMGMLLGHWQLRGYGMWAIEERGSGVMIGRVGFFNPEGWPGFEIGWVLGQPYWGRGYATEGARVALAYAFSELKQPHVISLIHPENRASIHVAKRLGERLEGHTELGGTEILVYGIRREAWNSTQVA